MLKKLSIAAAVVIAGASAAAAEAKVYTYDSGTGNYCPAGLQPITLNGVICCGTPNAGSYQAMMTHPAPKRKVKKVVKRHTHSHVVKHTHTTTYHTHTHSH